MECPKKAVVLAAGFGTRLRPLTWVRPKPLLPVWGEPMLARALSRLEAWGVEEIAVNAHWLAPQIRQFAASWKGRARLTVAEEPEILGTGGVLNPLRAWLGSEPFWLVNGDVLAEGLQCEPFLDAFERSGRFAACWLSSRFGPRTVEPDTEGRICNWSSPFPGDWGTATYCGWALLSPQVIGYLPPDGFSSIVQAYEKAMMQDARFVVGVEQETAWWADCGTLEAYLEAHLALDPERFEKNPNVLFPGVKLLDSAALAGCVATGGLIGGTFKKTALVGVRDVAGVALKEAAEALSWPVDDTAGVFLGARGSDRSFWRLVQGDARAIAIFYDDAARPENARYASHTRLLEKAGVPVPALLADTPALKTVVLEDLGSDALLSRACAPRADHLALYRPVVAALKNFHEEGLAAALAQDAQLEPSFGPELFAWEHALFETHCLKARFGLEAFPPAVREELDALSTALSRQRAVLVHRDCQSSNVLFRVDGTFAFIDYQGMRLGPAAYDLASLLYDPYVALKPSVREKLRLAYGGVSAADLSLAAVQRLLQALGAFGRLAQAGQASFASYIPAALDLLLEAADEASLDALGALAEDLIARENIRAGRFHAHHHTEAP